MADEQQATATTPQSKQDVIVKLRPTLFIGVGGTGMEAMLRVRRRILNASWGSNRSPVRIDSLADFPVAQFIHFDLDQGALLDSGRSQQDDPIAALVKLSDDDRLVETFDIEKYCRGDDDLAKYPHVESWSPFNPKRIRESGIDPAKGAGQMRAISRLYFFDKYPKIKTKIRNKLLWLKSGLTKDAKLKQLGLELDQSKFRIVVICSIAGGTGAGSFLDMGWLARWVANEVVNSADVELMLFMPTGYQSANKDRTEANGYASLMELETVMRGGSQYVARWDEYDRPELADKPYTEVYLVDSGNLAQLHTSDQRDVYDMVADALFEDFGSVDFANKKRSVAVNQAQHKLTPFSPPVPRERFGDMKLSYYSGYSAFGQAILDTQQSLQHDIRTYRWAGEMLKAFFGVASKDTQANRATDKQRDEFMAVQLQLAAHTFSDLPDISAKDVELRLAGSEFTEYALTDDLLADRQGSIVSGIQQKVDATIESIRTGFERKEWSTQIRAALKALERDVMRDQDSTADVSEDRVTRRANTVYAEMTERLRGRLYDYLDNKEFGGLEFVLSLVEQIKDRLENSNSGLIAALTLNAKRYAELRDAVRTAECERLLKNLEQTMGFSLFGNSEKQAAEIAGQLKVEIGNSLKFHVRVKAAEAAVRLLGRVSKWLGERRGVDEQGNAVWSGLVGELQAGRSAVLEMIGEVDRKVKQLREDTKKDHATYLRITAPAEQSLAMPGAMDLRSWADEAFKDFGGSRKLFGMLADPAQRAQLLGRLRAKADAQISALLADKGDEVDPLVLALDAMTATERQRKFSELLSRAMPWIDANWGKDFTPGADRFKCFIGVGRAREFKKYEDEIRSQVPANAGITTKQVEITDSGVFGRAVCYCELSGFPLTVLRGLEGWRTSYRKESEKIPVHTHRDPTRFTHPLTPTTGELNQLSDDFQQFLLAVMLGVLVRDTNARAVPPGQYQYLVGRGDLRRMGNERAFRLNGLPTTYRQQIMDAVAARIDVLDGKQVAALGALADYMAKEVYRPRLVQDESGAEVPRKGFASAMADSVAADLRARARRKGLSERQINDIENLAYDQLEIWTTAIENSDTDAYAWEVADPVDVPRLKRTVMKEFLQPGWIDGALGRSAPANAGIPGSLARSAIAPVPVLPGILVAPPLPPPPLAFHVSINGQAYGPFGMPQLQQMVTVGQVTPQTLVWREGMTAWGPAIGVIELAPLFRVSIGGVPPPLPQ